MNTYVGCQFYCGNKECAAFNTGFNINGSWPLGKIDDVIRVLIEERSNDENLDMQKIINSLEKRKANGVELAAVPLPNISNIEIVGKRVQLWCDNCTTVWDSDADDSEKTCARCDGELRDFNSLINDGIKCPHCTEDLKQERYYSREQEVETEEETEEENQDV